MYKYLFFFYILFFILLLGNSACKKDEVVPVITNDTTYTNFELISDTPSISFVSIMPDVVQEYQDSIQIIISYRDGGGDLGDSDPALRNLFVRDLRNNILYAYRIPKLSPDGSDITVQGNFSIVISNTIITNGSSEQKVQYEVYITDRAGHVSNTILSPEIKVIP